MTTHVEIIPVITAPTSEEEFRAIYDPIQCARFQIPPMANNSKKVGNKKRKRRSSSDADEQQSSLSLIFKTFQSLSENDKQSWCAENNNEDLRLVVDPLEFLSPNNRRNSSNNNNIQQGYASFILQDDTNQAVSNFSKQINSKAKLPLFPTNNDDNDEPSSSNNLITTADPFWVFVGRNASTTIPLVGRSEHTDDVQHDGTFHYQLVGSKTWKLRPTNALKEQCKEQHGMTLKDRYEITISEGEYFVINTRLWWHQTELPPTGCWSISLARDIYLDNAPTTQQQAPTTMSSTSSSRAPETMKNQDGAWAVGFLSKGSRLLTDTDDPPMMQRVSDKTKANCQLLKLDEEEEGCRYAVETLRDIQESEFFVLWDKNKKTGGGVSKKS